MENKTIIIIIILCFIIGSFTGYIFGFSSGLSWSFDKAMVLLDRQGIKINFDENMIKAGLLQYKNNIGGCLFSDSINNAPLYNNTGD